jgi:uncharacterized membrane protein
MDLFITIGYAVVTGTILLFLGVGSLIAIFLVSFVPGYVVVAALFPGAPTPERSEIDWIERVALSIGLSLAIVPLLGLLLNFTPWGIRFGPMISAIILITTLVGSVAYWRRIRLPPEQRLSLTISIVLPDWGVRSLYEKALTMVLAASMVIAGGTLAYVLLTPRPVETFTELYILGPDGNSSGDPTRLNVSQNGSIVLGIVNHEAAKTSYKIRVDLVGVLLVYNTTSGLNETFETNRTNRSWLNVTLADGEMWTYSYTFSINSSGVWKLQFLLYKDEVLSRQEVHLLIRVS